MSVPTCDATLAFARRSQEVGNVATAERLVAGLVNVQSPLDFKLIEGVAGIKLDIAHAQQPPTQIGAVIEELLVAHPRLVGSADFVSRLGALPPDVPFSSDALNIIFPKCEHDVDVHRQLFERALTIDPAFAEGHMRYADWILSSGTAVNACPSLAKYLTHVGDTVNGDVQVKAALQLLKIAVETGDAKHLKEASGASVWRLVLPQLFGVLRQTPPAVCDVVAEMIVAAGSTALPSVVYRLLSNDAHPASLVDHFRLAHRQLLTDTADFIAELSHISYLMEDRVLSSLMHFHDEIGKRFGSIKRLARSKEASVVQLQVESRLVPLVTALEASMSRLISNSNDKLDRPANEFEFLKAHSTSILEVIANLKQVVSDCPSDVTVIESAIAALTTIVTTLNKTFGGTRTVDLKSLSAKLLTLTNTCILIPGLARPVRLHALSTDVTILGTKTKPKKLIFIGEDGRKYPLLLKGTEDLHLDERVMQLLQVSNLGLQRTSRNYRETYRARHYAVVPIRERVGLIQWVDSAIPFYAMFKNWQIRKTATSADGVAVAGNTSTTVRRSMHSSRPIDYWSEKITRELAKRKISKSTSRRNWPVDALRKVFDELQAEAPQTLLMDELRSASSTASDWFQRRQQLTVSVAVMCILGHVIGLGDRHMDNQLFDLATGEIVHIDYNVCFDKGRRFRIPERVPFRLTQNLARVVRADPARGPFRAACDRTLTYLRESRGMVEHLLESFLHDPSISWLDSSVENTTQKSAEIDANVELLRMELDARAEAILELDRRLTEQLRATLGALSNAERQFDGNAQRMKTVATQLARLVNCWSTMVDQGKPIVLNTTTLLQTLCSIFSADDLVEHKQFAETANTARRAWRALQQKSVDAEETAKLMHSADRKTFISQLNAVV